MMQHYYTPESYKSIRREQYIDWGELLQELPDFAFRAACAEWIRRHSRRPTPADILKLAEQAGRAEMYEYYELKDAYRNAPSPEPGAERPTFDTDGNRISGDGGSDTAGEPWKDPTDTWEAKRQRWIARLERDESLVSESICRLFHLQKTGRAPADKRCNMPRDHTGDPFYEKFNNPRYRQETEEVSPEYAEERG